MPPPTKRRFAWSLWIPVILAFLLVIGAWVTVITIARKNPTESVPLNSESIRKDH
jgi:hypothetical protein